MRTDLEMRIVRVEVTPDMRHALEPLILQALDSYAGQLAKETSSPKKRGSVQITVSQAIEVLAARQPQWREKLTPVISGVREQLRGSSPRESGIKLHVLLKEVHLLLRREGAGAFREAFARADTNERKSILWTSVFSRRAIGWLEEQDLLGSPDGLEVADSIVECLKLWVDDLAQTMTTMKACPEPSDFFLDVEGDVSATLTGARFDIKVRGRPDALLLRPSGPEVELIEYKFAEPDLVELRIAQVVLYMALLEKAKGVKCSRGSLVFFRGSRPIDENAPSSQSEFPSEVDDAFRGYIGNAPTVRRLKIGLALARRNQPAMMGDNYLFTGPGGLGKTELARRVARALGSIFVNLPAGGVRGIDDLVETVDQALSDEGKEATEAGRESGRPVYKYPPLVLFFDEVHELRRRADQFLNLLEPKERRAVARDKIGDFSAATILGATTDLAKLPGPFLTRFRRVDLEPYTAEDVAKMLMPVFADSGLQISEEVALLLAKIGRCNPRRSLEFAKEFRDQHNFAPRAVPLTENALTKLAKEEWRVDAYGLNSNDYLYLSALQTGPKGLGSLQQIIPVAVEEITKLIEPYLLQLGAIKLTPGGRALTVKGEQLLKGRDA